MKKYEAKNVDEALKAACADKGVTLEQLKYNVLEESRGGLFGFGAKTIIEAYCEKDIADFITGYLETYFGNMNMPVQVSCEKKDSDSAFRVKINAENNAILIGKSGQTLDSIKNVVNSAANAQFKCHVYMTLDINGYKKEKYDKLKNTVENIARTVIKTKVPVRLDELTADERKVVHQHLSNMKHIKTESEGSGNDRRLKIIYDKNKN